ncbi:MAG: DUF554 domain-containing protein [Christensenellaceae bacterium]
MFVPMGVFMCNAAIVAGGLIGGRFGGKIPLSIKNVLPLIFGLCTVGIAITCIVQVNTLGVVIISAIAGTIIGTALRLEDRVQGLFTSLIRKTKLDRNFQSEADMQYFITITVIMCVGGAGIFGALNEGITGDHALLAAKSILDLFSAVIFAATLGYAVCLVGIFQCIILLALFFCARFLMPLISPAMLGDFNACGGLITLAAGFKLCKMFDIKLVNLLPSLVLVLPVSWLWTFLPL